MLRGTLVILIEGQTDLKSITSGKEYTQEI